LFPRWTISNPAIENIKHRMMINRKTREVSSRFLDAPLLGAPI